MEGDLPADEKIAPEGSSEGEERTESVEPGRESSGEEDIFDLGLEDISSAGSMKIQQMLIQLLDKYRIPENLENIEYFSLPPREKIGLEKALAKIKDIATHIGGLEGPNVLMRVGVANFLVGDYQGAIEYFEKAGEAGHDQYLVKSHLGFCLFRLRDYDGAKKIFNEVLESGQKIGLAYYGTGLIKESEGNYPAAISMYKIATKVSPKAVGPWMKLARAYEDVGRENEALRCYKTVVSIEDDFVDAWIGLANLSLLSEKPEKALEYVKTATELNPERADSWHLRGNIHEELGQSDQAMQSYEKANELEPSEEAVSDKGDVYLRLGKYDEALDCYQKALEENANNVEAIRGTALAMAGLGKFDEAMLAIERAEDLQPHSLETRVSKGDIQVMMGRYEEAEKEFRSIISDDAFYKESYEHLGALYAALLRYRKSVEAFTNLLDLDPENERARIYLDLLGNVLNREIVKLEGGEAEKRRREFRETADMVSACEGLFDALRTAGIELSTVEEELINVRSALFMGQFTRALSFAYRLQDDLMRKAETEVEQIYKSGVQKYNSIKESNIILPFDEKEFEIVQNKYNQGDLGEAAIKVADLIRQMRTIEYEFEKCIELLNRAGQEIKNLNLVGMHNTEMAASLEEAKELFTTGKYSKTLDKLDDIHEIFRQVKKKHQKLLDAVSSIEENKKKLKEEGMDADSLGKFEVRIKAALDKGKNEAALKISDQALEHMDNLLKEMEKKKIDEDINATVGIIIELKGEGANVSMAEAEIKEATAHLEKGEPEEASKSNKAALELAMAAKDRLRAKESQELIAAAAAIVKNLGNYNEDVTPLEKGLAEAKEMVSGGQYLEAKEKTLDIRRRAMEGIRKYSEEIAKKIITDARDLQSKMTAVGCPESEVESLGKIIKEAESALEYMDYRTAEAKGKRAVKEANESLRSFYEKKIGKWISRIMTVSNILVKYAGKVVDTDTKVRTVREMIGNGRYDEAMEYATEVREHLKEQARKYMKQAAEETVAESEELITSVETSYNVSLAHEKSMLESARQAIRYSDYENALYTARDSIDNARNKEAKELRSKYEDEIGEIDEQMVVLEKLEALSREDKKAREKVEDSLRQGKFKGIKALIFDLNRSLHAKLEKEIGIKRKEILEEVEPLLGKIRAKGVDVEEYQDVLEETGKALEKGELVEVYGSLANVRADIIDLYQDTITKDIRVEREEIREEMKQVQSRGEDVRIVDNQLKEADKALISKDFQVAREQLKQARSILIDKGKKYFKEKYREELRESRELLQNLEGLGIDITVGNTLVKDAANALRYEDFMDAKAVLKKLKTFSVDKLEEHQHNEAKKSLQELLEVIEGIKDMGGELPEGESKLEKAREAYKDKEYVRSKTISVSALSEAKKKYEHYFFKKIYGQIKHLADRVNVLKSMGYPSDNIVPLESMVQNTKKMIKEKDLVSTEKSLLKLRSEWYRIRNEALLAHVEENRNSINDRMNQVMEDEEFAREYKERINRINGTVSNAIRYANEQEGDLAMYYALKAENTLSYLETLFHQARIDEVLSKVTRKVRDASAVIDTSAMEERLSEIRTRVMGLVPSHPKTQIIIRDALKELRSMEEESETILTRSRIEKAKDAIDSADELIRELRDIGVEIVEAEELLERAKSLYQESLEAKRAVDVVSVVVKAMDLATQASDIALEGLREHQVERGQKAIRDAKSMLDEAEGLGMDVSKYGPSLEKAKETYERGDYLEATGMAEQVIDSVQADRKKYLMIRSKESIAEAEKRIERISKEGVNVAPMNKLIVTMKEKFARDLYTEVLSLSLKLKGLMQESESEVRAKRIKEKTASARSDIEFLESVNMDTNEMKVALNEINDLLEKEELDKAESTTKALETRVESALKDSLPAYIDKTVEKYSPLLERDRELGIDSSQFRGRLDQLENKKSDFEEGGLAVEDVMAIMEEFRTKYLEHRFKALKNKISGMIKDLRQEGSDVTSLEQRFNEAEVVSSRDMEAGIRSLINLLDSIRSHRERFYNEKATNTIKESQIFLDRAKGFEDIDLSPMREKLDTLEELVKEDRMEDAYGLVEHLQGMREKYGKILEKMELSARIEEVKKKAEKMEDVLSNEVKEDVRESLSGSSQAMAKGDISKARSLIERVQGEIDDKIDEYLTLRTDLISHWLVDTLGYYGELLSGLGTFELEQRQRVKALVERKDTDALVSLIDEANEKVEEERKKVLLSYAKAVQREFRGSVKLLKELVEYYDEYIDRVPEISDTGRGMDRIDEGIDKGDGPLSVYYALRSLKRMENIIRSLASDITGSLQSEIEDMKGRLDKESMDLSNVNQIISAGRNRVKTGDVQDFREGLELLVEGRDKLRGALGQHYRKIISSMLLSLESMMRDLESRGIESSEVRSLFEQGKDLMARENWIEAEKVLKKADQIAKGMWGQFEKDKLEPIITEMLEIYEDLKEKGADISDIKDQCEEMFTAFEKNRYDEVKSLIPRMEDALSMAVRRYRNTAAKKRYMKKKAEENIDLIAKEIEELEELGYELDEAEEFLNDARYSFDKNNFSKSVQDALRARQLISKLTKDFEEKKASGNIEKLESLISESMDLGIDLGSYKRQLKDAQTLFSSGDFVGSKGLAKNAFEKAEKEAFERLRDRMNMYKERVEELREKYEKFGLESTDIFLSAEEITDKISSMDEKEDITSFVELSNKLRDLMSDAYDNYLEKLTVKAESRVDELEADIKMLISKGIDVGLLYNEINEPKELLKKGNPDEAMIRLDYLENRLLEFGGETGSERTEKMDRKMAMEAYDALSEGDKMFNKVRSMAGADVETKANAEIKLEQAKEAFENERWNDALKLALETKKLLKPYASGSIEGVKGVTEKTSIRTVPEEIKELKAEISKAKGLGLDVSQYEDMMDYWEDLRGKGGNEDRIEGLKTKAKSAVEEIKGMYALIDSTQVFMIKKAQRALGEVERMAETLVSIGTTVPPEEMKEIYELMEKAKDYLENGNPMSANQTAVKAKTLLKKYR